MNGKIQNGVSIILQKFGKVIYITISQKTILINIVKNFPYH